MPSRNVIRIDTEDTYYHVYARGASKQPIFLEEQDFLYFLALLGRYLSNEPTKNSAGIPYLNYKHRLELLSYCLMRNHFHLLAYQIEVGALTGLMRGVMTSYSRYFNNKYSRTGSLFESRYKASRIDREDYLQHITRYIHLNPRYWRRYPYSSLRHYIVNTDQPDWLTTDKVLEQFDNRKQYLSFHADYVSKRDELQTIKTELADT